jgi:predicted enzyme related to lactoylglutathione lyase
MRRSPCRKASAPSSTPSRTSRQGLTVPLGYWEVDDIHTSLKALLDAGAETRQELKDVGGGKLIASAKDADRNGIGLMQSA